MWRIFSKTATIFCALAMFAETPTEAQKPTTIHGAGGSSCGQYVQVYDAYRPFRDENTGGVIGWQARANYWQYEEWIEGYLFGVDSWNKRQVRNYDEAAMQVWFYNYCQKQPLDVVANAALAFYKELGGPTPTGGNR